MTKDKFKRFREQKKWTQQKMATELGVKQQRVSDWESGKRRIPLYIEKLIGYLTGKKVVE